MLSRFCFDFARSGKLLGVRPLGAARGDEADTVTSDRHDVISVTTNGLTEAIARHRARRLLDGYAVSQTRSAR
jgi:hypothetical protein